MLKRFSCVALGVLLTSLVSSVGPTYAMTIRSSNFNTADSFDTTGLGDVNFGVETPGAISRGTGTGDGDNGDLDEAGIIIAFGTIIALILLEGGSSNETAVSPVTLDPSDSIPTPALLPGLIGMGMAAIRKKRNLAQTD